MVLLFLFSDIFMTLLVFLLKKATIGRKNTRETRTPLALYSILVASLLGHSCPPLPA